MKLKLALFALFLPALAQADNLETGEHLITKFDASFGDYTNYQPFSMSEHDSEFTLWKSAERGFSDHFAVNIGSITGKSLLGFKRSQDEPADRTCKSHQSTPAVETIVNGYNAISWKSVCVLDDLTITSLQLAIMGNEHFYHMRKLWKIPVSDDKIVEWQTLLNQSNVCDTTNSAHACPAE